MPYEIVETRDVEACRALRLTVFVQEQNVPIEDEIDDLDETSTHFLAQNENGIPIGTARIFELGDVGKIGRVCVLNDFRGLGLGAALITHCFKTLEQREHLSRAKLGAQEHAIPFYEKLGFTVIGDPYMDGGIPHIDMQRPFVR